VSTASISGTRPAAGEAPYAAAKAAVVALTLHELKHHLDRCIERQGRA